MLEAVKKAILGAVASGGSAAISSHTYEASYSDGSVLTTSKTFSSCDIGTADANRYVVVAISSAEATTSAIDSVTIAGETATIARQSYDSHENEIAATAYAKVTTGSTGDVVVTYNGNVGGIAISVFTIVVTSGATLAEYDGHSDVNGTMSYSINIAENGVVIGAWTGGNTNTVTWTNATERIDISAQTNRLSTGSYQASTEETGRTISAGSGASDSAGVLSSFYAV